MKAIIIAAGMGNRLNPYTLEKPKCLLKIGETTLLENLIKKLRTLHIEEIAIVVGYKAEQFNLEGVTYFINDNYQNNNILHSLMYAKDFMDDDIIISYSDIWLNLLPLKTIVATEEEIVISVDTQWKEYYEGRTDHPISQAEKVLFDNQAKAQQFGKHIDLNCVTSELHCGEFIGLFKMSQKFCGTFIQEYENLNQTYKKNDPFQHSLAWEKAYLTDFFSELVEKGYSIQCSLHEKQWYEIDTAQDYENLLQRIEKESQFKKILGSRILSEANDLKRTVNALANDLKMDEDELKGILQGRFELDAIYQVIEKMGEVYPIDKTDLYMPIDDCIHGVKIMRSTESRDSSRIFDRKNRHGTRTPYYEYRDTAMSSLAPFRPEWIKELRVVDNNDPQNPDVIYNDGHFMHQITFFVGSVNFYWEVNGKKFCREMNTGDSNYITPYWRHSFANRDKNQTAFIVAVTFGGEVRRSQKEFYTLGEKAKEYILDYRNHNRGMTQLILQHMANENITIDALKEMVVSHAIHLNIDHILDETREKSREELEAISKLLHIEMSELMLPQYQRQEEVIVKHRSEQDSYFYPNAQEALYQIFPSARTSKMPTMKGFELEILSSEINIHSFMKCALHSYIYNFGKAEIELCWMDKEKQNRQTIHPGDSIYIQPYIQHGFASSRQEAKLFIVRISGAVNFSTQKELSYFSETQRVFEEDRCWFH